MTMHHWQLDRTGNKPLVIEAECLTGLKIENYYNAKSPQRSHGGAHLFLTKGGRYILHVSSGHSSYGFGGVKYAAMVDVDQFDDLAILEFCGGPNLAKPILRALGRETEERIE